MEFGSDESVLTLGVGVIEWTTNTFESLNEAVEWIKDNAGKLLLYSDDNGKLVVYGDGPFIVFSREEVK